jgi:hypothetical protein
MTSINSKRTAKRKRDTHEFRYDLCAEVGRCEGCGKRKRVNELACHELLAGPFRQKCLSERCAILVLALCCHAKIQNESKPRQLGRLYLSRPQDFDLAAFLVLWCRAPGAIEMAEVDAEIANLLGELPVDNVMRNWE